MVKRTWPYDMWSLGVVWLELVVATPHVFQISPRTAALLERHLHHKSPVTVGLLCCAPDLNCCRDAGMLQDELILRTDRLNSNV